MPARAALVAAAVTLLVGLVATTALLVSAQRRPGAQIDAFARAAVGCTTVVRVERAGEYFVFAELGAEPVERAGCTPVADPEARFAVEVAAADGVSAVIDDRSVTYSRGVVSAGSIQRLVADGPVDVVVTVVGSDAGVVAALGPDPQEGVDERRAWALLVGAITLIVSGVLFVAAARSREPFDGEDGTDAYGEGWSPESVWAPPQPEQRRGGPAV